MPWYERGLRATGGIFGARQTINAEIATPNSITNRAVDKLDDIFKNNSTLKPQTEALTTEGFRIKVLQESALEKTPTTFESRAQQILSGGKAVNLPAWEKLSFRVDAGETKPHFLTGHKTGEGRLAQSIKDGGKKTVFPEWMTEKQILKSIKEAYGNGKKVKTQTLGGEKVVTVEGISNGLNIRMHINLDLNRIESAYTFSKGVNK